MPIKKEHAQGRGAKTGGERKEGEALERERGDIGDEYVMNVFFFFFSQPFICVTAKTVFGVKSTLLKF